jgi:hypothetical protein
MFDFFSHRQTSSKMEIFHVPTPDPFENPLVETHPGPLRQWATSLPFANPEQLADAVLNQLVRLNRFPGPVRKRDELMEVYFTPVQRLLHGSVARRGSASTQALRRVSSEMAYGYSHLANECINNKASKKNQERLTHAIYFALKFFLLEYLYACEEFDCRSSHTYREISRLCTYAEEQNIHLTPIDEGDHPGVQRSIEQQYKRFLLLCLLDPCHLQEGEPRICFDYLDNMAGHARITPLSREIECSGHYVIDRLGDVPPTLFEPDGMDTLSQPRFTLFDLNPVSQQIHLQLRSLERSEEHKPAAMSRLTANEVNNLLARMLRSWHIRLQRGSERHTTAGEVSIWTGLNNIHLYLRQCEQPDRNEAEAGDTEITLSQAPTAQTRVLDPSRPQLMAQRYNQSRSGVALHLNLSPNAPSLVGELILISLQSGAAMTEWKIGIVKRALNREGEALEIGVQFVPRRIVPITLQAAFARSSSLIGEDAEEPPCHPGLYIDQGHHHRSSLIVPRHLFSLGQEYRVEEMIPTPLISPLQLLESTAHFERYRIKPA